MMANLHWYEYCAGLCLWILGIAIEATADEQKRRFRNGEHSETKFICHGLWRYSRHPNYFGEILVWVGMFVLCVCKINGAWGRSLAVLSPLLVTVLLTKVSGIPLLEKAADKKWGDSEAYKAYKARTNVLLLWFPRRA